MPLFNELKRRNVFKVAAAYFIIGWLIMQAGDVTQGFKVARRATVMQSKTKRPVQFEISDQTRDAIRNLVTKFKLTPNQFLFLSRLSSSPHLSTRQYAKIVKEWVADIGLDPDAYGTHS